MGGPSQASYETTFSWDSELSADSVEFCPIEGHRDIVVVGTYFVSASDADTFSPSQRRGRIYLMELKHHHQGEPERCVLCFKNSNVVFRRPGLFPIDFRLIQGDELN